MVHTLLHRKLNKKKYLDLIFCQCCVGDVSYVLVQRLSDWAQEETQSFII